MANSRLKPDDSKAAPNGLVHGDNLVPGELIGMTMPTYVIEHVTLMRKRIKADSLEAAGAAAKAFADTQRVKLLSVYDVEKWTAKMTREQNGKGVGK